MSTPAPPPAITGSPSSGSPTSTPTTPQNSTANTRTNKPYSYAQAASANVDKLTGAFQLHAPGTADSTPSTASPVNEPNGKSTSSSHEEKVNAVLKDGEESDDKKKRAAADEKASAAENANNDQQQHRGGYRSGVNGGRGGFRGRGGNGIPSAFHGFNTTHTNNMGGSWGYQGGRGGLYYPNNGGFQNNNNNAWRGGSSFPRGGGGGRPADDATKAGAEGSAAAADGSASAFHKPRRGGFNNDGYGFGGGHFHPAMGGFGGFNNMMMGGGYGPHSHHQQHHNHRHNNAFHPKNGPASDSAVAKSATPKPAAADDASAAASVTTDKSSAAAATSTATAAAAAASVDAPIERVATCTIRIRGLPYTVTREEIEAFVKDYPIDTSATSGYGRDSILLITKGGARGEGYVRFQNAQIAEEALHSLHKAIIGDRYVELYDSSDAEMAQAKDHQEEVIANANPIIRVRGLPFTATIADLRAFFDDIPEQEILDISLCYSNDGKLTGDAFVEFAGKKGLALAQAKHSSQLGTRYLEIIVSNQHEKEVILHAARGKKSVIIQQQRRANKAAAAASAAVTAEGGDAEAAAAAAAAAAASVNAKFAMAAAMRGRGAMGMRGGGGGRGAGGRGAGGPHNGGEMVMGGAGGPAADPYSLMMQIMTASGNHGKMSTPAGAFNTMFEHMTSMMMNSPQMMAMMGMAAGAAMANNAYRGMGSMVGGPGAASVVPTAAGGFGRGAGGERGGRGRGRGRGGFNAPIDANEDAASNANKPAEARKTPAAEPAPAPTPAPAPKKSMFEVPWDAPVDTPVESASNHDGLLSAVATDPRAETTAAAALSSSSAAAASSNSNKDGETMKRDGPVAGRGGAGGRGRGGRGGAFNAPNQPQAQQHPPQNFPALSPMMMMNMMNPQMLMAMMQLNPNTMSMMIPPRAPSPWAVRVRGLPFNTNETAIGAFFSDVNIAPQGVHMAYSENERPTGEAYVEVLTREDMDKALRYSGRTMGKRYIEVFPSSGDDIVRLGGGIPAEFFM